MRFAVLRCLKPLAQDTPAELFNLRLGHRCLDVKHRPLLRVGQVELAADAGDRCDASAVAHLQELGQFEHLPLEAVLRPDRNCVDPSSLDVVEQSEVLGAGLPRVLRS